MVSLSILYLHLVHLLVQHFAMLILKASIVEAEPESFCNHTSNLLGVCVDFPQKIRYCPIALEAVTTKDKGAWESFRQNFCTRTIRKGQLCCPLEGNGAYLEDTKYYGVDPEKPEEDYTQHKNWPIFEHAYKKLKCGWTLQEERVIGGGNAKLGQFPWMARIGYLLGDNSTLFTCSGTVITERYILTAAHCVKHWVEYGLELAPVRLADLEDEKDPEVAESLDQVWFQDIPIEDVLVHPGYLPTVKGSHNDIALIRLANPIKNLARDFYIRALCLPFTKQYRLGERLDETMLVAKRGYRNDMGIIAGWGKVNNADPISSSMLQSLRVPLKPSIECRILYPEQNVSSQQICVGGEEGKGSCLGDSGSPLVISPKQDRYYQIGIVSFGAESCGQNGVPSVYTRVRDYLRWILDTVKD